MPATTTMGMLGRPPTQAFALGSESVPYLNRHCEQLEATHTTEGSVFQVLRAVIPNPTCWQPIKGGEGAEGEFGERHPHQILWPAGDRLPKRNR